MQKQPDQELYDEVFKVCQALGYDVFTYLLPDKTPYPFVYIGESQELPQATKSVLVGTIQLNIHIYGLHTKRKQVSDMKGAILWELRKLRQSKNFNWKISNNQTQPQMLQDTTTNTALWHCVIPLEMRFY
ncbi:hypothetical protein P7D71_21230 [Enterococcus raffinosus]|uniref:phage capsid protein n=1 Tax=Enterococcus raffinosus TaxID=71452 RepID=UPI0028918238|nr:phage capsid protein [Enterococcus raffinosus]MDT2580317.1 hypothetical protein [Enterococcus raffinosus]